LGDDAAQFADANDNAATVEDGGEEDLLGGGGGYQNGGGGGGNEMMDEFESSFPAMDTRNEVCALLSFSVSNREATGPWNQAMSCGC